MIKICVISVGKLKEKYLKDAVKEYAKRLGAYCKLSFVEVADESINKNDLSEVESSGIKSAEAEKIKRNLKQGQYIISLDLKGKELSSEDFSEHIDKLAVSGKSELVFIIGGSLGLADEILKMSDFRLCFSKMTFPHQLMKVILLEQIYRAFKISRGETYHK